MPQQVRIVGVDVSKATVDACIRSLRPGCRSGVTPQRERELVAWLCQNRAGLAVMEASGGYERGWPTDYGRPTCRRAGPMTGRWSAGCGKRMGGR